MIEFFQNPAVQTVVLIIMIGIIIWIMMKIPKDIM